MPESTIAFVNTVLVPAGLMAIMFSLGLTLALRDFMKLAEHPRPVLAGLTGHFLCLPLLGLAIAWLFRLPPEMATGLFILSVCPAGVTSNAVTFAARGNVALAVILTTLTSIITVITTPILIGWALDHYFGMAANAPVISVPKTIKQLVMMTVLPIACGMIVRRLQAAWADRLVNWLRPTSLVILVAVILFSLLVSADLVLKNLIHAGPAAWVLNVSAMASGLLIARLFGLGRADSMTIGIEVGVQNATMATFLALSILNSWELAITPTIYGCIMIVNAGLMVRILKSRWRKLPQE
ncbi:bile acid:sodium symporter family protein [Govanella unica]|uniref:Bile acid:sodium symporter family protein n=1 Tax=Govanella unica TaxID=2975056 RepID=A0A9X3TZV2_9PROT|nr:bile acid:sodium symporter family protein [Govania unica]